MVAHHGGGPREIEALRRCLPEPPGRGTVTGRAILTGSVVQADIAADPEHEFRELTGILPHRPGGAHAAGRRPPIGAIAVNRREGRPFTAEADRAARDLRRPGGDRDRERPPVPGARARNRDLERGPRAADGHRGDPRRHLELADRPRARLRQDPRQGLRALRRAARRRLPPGRRAFDAAAWRGVRQEFAELLRTREYRVGRPMFRPEGPWHPVHIEDVTKTAIMQDPNLVEIVRDASTSGRSSACRWSARAR